MTKDKHDKFTQEFNWFDELDKVYNNPKIDPAGSKATEDTEEPMNMSEHKLMRARVKSFQDLIGWSEGTTTIKASEGGFNVIVGGELFHDYSDHPRVLVDIPRYNIKSSASGKYQILERYWDHYSKQLGLKDFSPKNQDRYAMNMFREVGALEDIEEGRIEEAIKKCASRWASFPSAGYGQREVEMKKMLDKFDELLQDNLKRHDV